MNHDEFNIILESTIEKMRSLASVKGGEYAPDANRLSNFEHNAELLGLQPLDVWAVYAMKHMDAVVTYIKDMRDGKIRERSEPIEGRADDLIVYLALFKGLVADREKKQTLGQVFIRPEVFNRMNGRLAPIVES